MSHDADESNATGPAFASDKTLLPAIAQDAESGRVLMMAHMNREAYEETLRSGVAVYFSRSRGRLWKKGEQSGNVQHIKQILIDCDRDTILLKVEQLGPGACHKGYASCFYREVAPDGLKIVEPKTYDPEKAYQKDKATGE